MILIPTSKNREYSRKYRVPGKLIIYRKSDGKTLSFKCFQDEIDKIIHFNCSIKGEPGSNNVIKCFFNGNKII